MVSIYDPKERPKRNPKLKVLSLILDNKQNNYLENKVINVSKIKRKEKEVVSTKPGVSA